MLKALYVIPVLFVFACSHMDKADRKVAADGNAKNLAYDAHGRLLGEDSPKPDEGERFAALGKRTSDAIRKVEARFKSGTNRRGFHAKQHGCLKGTLEVAKGNFHMVNQGIFREPGRKYEIWTRFSNGFAFSRFDARPDFRGMAVKVLDVQGEQVLPERKGTSTQDFVMLDNETSLFPNADGPVELLEAMADGGVNTYAFAAKHPAFAKIMTGKLATPDLLKVTYFNATAIKFGPYAGKARLRACDIKSVKTPKSPSRTDRDYLRKRLASSLKKGEACFKLEAQFQLDAESEPVEDSYIPWKTPYHEIATLRFPAQEFDTSEQNKFCESLAFSPWFGVAEHRPLGETNRIRKVVYHDSQITREADFSQPKKK